MKIKLSADQIECLREIAAHDKHLLGLLAPQADIRSPEKFIVCLDRETSEQFRDLLTYQLGMLGFDNNDEVNAEGRMLEDLIDRLFRP